MISTKSQSLILAALAAAPAVVSAHGHVTQITINGVTIPGFEPGNPSPDSVGWATTVTDNGFVLADSALQDPDIVCHRGATNALNSATVAAGDTITVTWDTWPESHVGPIIDYLANCDGDCSTVEKTSLEFFKFNEGALIDGTNAPGRWVTDELIEDGFTWTTTIPPSVAPGSYVWRHEIIALHEGHERTGTQMYPQCINLEITGSGSAQPAGVIGTELYTTDDEGIFFSPYRPNLVYPIPGPENTFASGGSAPVTPPAGGNDDEEETETPAPVEEETETPAPVEENDEEAETPSNPPAGGDNGSDEEEVETPSVPAPVVPAPTTLATATRGCEATQPPTSGAGQPLYHQCGGLEYTGSTTCAEGTCVEQNPYYFQCV